jgi:hypothetical protein
LPEGLLKPGDNEIRITTISGSWVLFDWLALTAPAGVESAQVRARTSIGKIQPVRKLTVYILPHSHTDIGYTEIQPDVEKNR